MIVSTNIRYVDKDEREKTSVLQFDTKDIKRAEPSMIFPGHTTIHFYDDDIIDACIRFSDYQAFIQPPQVRWSGQKKPM